MTLLSSLGRASRSAPLASKLLILGSLSGGSLVAYSDSNVKVKNKEQKKKKVVVLGTGWAGISFLKDHDITSYDVQACTPKKKTTEAHLSLMKHMFMFGLMFP
ncbi:unnamed protein product [Arabis nemorensis]|uniref:FAD/NAD(P)-binding domain-containing protein n=1 Tax=Arabis nemorensis TaxID=586526 RepID=A0A565BEF5_9BRAS|nr:unnamed protein product [Arabis nemorensis]